MIAEAPPTKRQAASFAPVLSPITDYYRRLQPLETVQAMYAEWHQDGLDVWLILNQATEEDREQIYKHELALMQAFPGLGLDTRLIERTDVDVEESIDLTTVDVFLRFPRLTHA